eukprot:m.889721 g.889721  ORF g.889721 m.889721 type:complete len:90 (-) comp23646_c0_seq12:2716-2985(-)
MLCTCPDVCDIPDPLLTRTSAKKDRQHFWQRGCSGIVHNGSDAIPQTRNAHTRLLSHKRCDGNGDALQVVSKEHNFVQHTANPHCIRVH